MNKNFTIDGYTICLIDYRNLQIALYLNWMMRISLRTWTAMDFCVLILFLIQII